MRRAGLAACAVLVLALPACAGMAREPVQASPEANGGYLSAGDLTRLADRVPPPPAEGSAEARADVAASGRLRALENGDRWLLATRHAELRPGVALAHFDCALGFRIVAADSPRLVSLLSRVLRDANGAAELAKARAHRPRPVAVDRDRPACQVLTEVARASASYPSGSASVGAAYGAAMAALVPDRAEAVREIGRQIGVSRSVCAMHYPSDVAAGQALGLQVFDALSATPAFAAEAEAARVEIAVARAAALTSPACAAERAALAIPLP